METHLIQNFPENTDPFGPYGFRVAHHMWTTVAKLLSENPSPFVDIREIDPSIVVNLKYAEPDNVMGFAFYPSDTLPLLRWEVAMMLAESQRYLQRTTWEEYSLIVYDAWRPQSAQERLWEWATKENKTEYVANPEEGSMHTFWCAVDVSILRNGEPLDMGAWFDQLDDISQPKEETRFFWEWKLTRNHLENRKLLREVMSAGGFSSTDSEWWHFETPDDNDNYGRRKNIRESLPRIP